jgi:hypothetical protein
MGTRWLGLIWFVCASAAYAESPVTAIAAHKHLGVASCASGVCHGSTQVFKESNVMQNEFAYWQEFDPHATKAYQALTGAEGQAIARKLGLGDAAQAKICLDCHADNVPAEMRGEKFQITDGVGCEACHGGSEQWISAHADKGAKHQDNLAQGLYKTEDPIARAKLCLSCHMGTTDRMITHRIMGAGHPRLSFELDTFTWLNPHYQIDDDYIARKGAFNGVRDWGVGQGIAAVTLIDTLLDERAGWQGIFPELVLFDCLACHKPMSANKWAPRQGTGLGPGVVRLNDANLVMFRHVLSVVDAGASQRVFDQTRALHQATQRDRASTYAAARTLRATIEGALPAIAGYDWDGAGLGPVLGSLVKDAERGEFRDFAAAEQAAQAAQSVVVAFQNAGQLDEQRRTLLQARMDRLYDAVGDADRYQMGAFVTALKDLRAAAP